jgi:hypothetical protein
MLRWPSARAPGVLSCMRFMARSSVLLPQPEGPISAVTSPCGIAMLIASRALKLP